ncbi:MAG: DUF2934 domain-containing protein [Chitinispirillaceae bacterium]|jgi:hypothetical protein|nr:DUF2934 domain-containing protein [Chitinispirillaceae bacterium]
MDSVKEMIEKRAYHLFLKRGGVHGYAHQDWQQAEKEITAEIEAKKKAGAKAAQAPAAPLKPKAAEVKPAPKAVKKSR